MFNGTACPFSKISLMSVVSNFPSPVLKASIMLTACCVVFTTFIRIGMPAFSTALLPISASLSTFWVIVSVSKRTAAYAFLTSSLYFAGSSDII